MEASLQQQLWLNSRLFYILLFLATVWYYNVPYLFKPVAQPANLRDGWYQHHRTEILKVQALIAMAVVAGLSVWLLRYGSKLDGYSASVWVFAGSFPLGALLYYGFQHRSIGRINLRRVGLLKPFVIGYTWAGAVTVFPALQHALEGSYTYEMTGLGLLLFIKNFLFISLLSIVFDFKDYATDQNQQLKTLVVTLGIRRTIRYVILPLTGFGWFAFLGYGIAQGFPVLRLVLNTIPFLSLIVVSHSFGRHRSIFFYLVVIDGLMLLKACCGIAAAAL